MPSPILEMIPAVPGLLRFSFQECLGAGSFGEVYRARVRREGEAPREVAVKVLRLERREQREAVTRLRDEARMLAVLDHPAILRFEEFTRVEGRIALVTEYVDGTDLDRFLDAEHRMPTRVALEVLADVASALQSALNTPSPETGNPLGLIHRDIKPHNIRISSRGVVKLLDFGIARTSELSRDAKTWAGDVVCTPGFAAPEVLCGDARGSEGDVYSLAVTLFQLLAHEPFHTEQEVARQRRAVLLRRRYTEFLAGRLAVLPALPDGLMALLEQMLAHDPEDRPTAAEVEAEMRRIAAQLPEPGLVVWARTLPPQTFETFDGELTGLETIEQVMSAVPTATPPGGSLRPPMERLGPPSTPPMKLPELPEQEGPAPQPASGPNLELLMWAGVAVLAVAMLALLLSG